MRKTKKILSILLSCLMLMSLLSVGVFAAEGTKDNPINANDKWFANGVDIFLLNPTLEAGDTDGIWYELTADAAGILQLENSYKEVDYQITVNVNGHTYMAYENGMYNRPVMTLPVAVGDVISIHIIAQDTTQSGLVYCSAKFVDGSNDINQMIKLKGANVKVWIANGATVYLQDDSLQGDYAAAGLKLENSVLSTGITVISNNKSYTDTDGDGYVELKLGGSAGSTGAPAVKPSFAIENQSGQDAWFVLNVVENTAHECVYDNDEDAYCNTCGAGRVEGICKHVEGEPTYTGEGDDQHQAVYACTLCGEILHTEWEDCYGGTASCSRVAQCVCCGFDYGTEDDKTHVDEDKDLFCDDCEADLDDNIFNDTDLLWPCDEHTYTDAMDTECDVCGAIRIIEYTVLTFGGNSVSEDVNGLAFRFDVDHTTLTLLENTLYGADYANSTVSTDSASTYQLVKMGAVLSNNWGITRLDYVDGTHVLDVPAAEIQGINEGNPFFVVRIIDIPETHFNNAITCTPYYIYKNAEGEEIVVYGDEMMASYSSAAEEAFS